MVNKPPEPFCIGFNKCGVAREDGLSCKTLISYGKTYMGAALENGDRLVGFPERVKKIQLRIVVGCVPELPVDGSTDACMLSSYSGTGMILSTSSRR